MKCNRFGGTSGLCDQPDSPRVSLYCSPSSAVVSSRLLLAGCSPGQIDEDLIRTVEPSGPTLATVLPVAAVVVPALLIGAPFFNSGETISYARHSGSCRENGTPVSGFTALSERTRSFGHPAAPAFENVVNVWSGVAVGGPTPLLARTRKW